MPKRKNTKPRKLNAERLFNAIPALQRAFADVIPPEVELDETAIECICGSCFDVKPGEFVECSACPYIYARTKDAVHYYPPERGG